jgi:hypothetical protein
MLTARVSADRARAKELAAPVYAFARKQQTRGQELFSRRDFSGARIAFEAAADGYTQAESAARAPAPRPEPEKFAARVPPPTHEPSRPTAAAPTAAPLAVELPRAVPPAPEAPRRSSPADADRIRETVSRYVKAQSTLDPDLYAQVYPSIDRSRIRTAFEELRSQTLEFEIRSVEVSGSTAVVRGYEKRLIVPRIGSEQRVNAERTIRLEKRGDAWVITRLN